MTVKEQNKDESTAYPTYGRNLPAPSDKMNSFMIQQDMAKKKELTGVEKVDDDLKLESGALKRQRIISPNRKKYEKKWEQYEQEKYVEQ